MQRATRRANTFETHTTFQPPMSWLQTDVDQSTPLICSAPHRWEPSAGSLPWNALEAFNGIDELIDRGHDFQAYPMRRSFYSAT